jgi:hypothetical protein
MANHDTIAASSHKQLSNQYRVETRSLFASTVESSHMVYFTIVHRPIGWSDLRLEYRIYPMITASKSKTQPSLNTLIYTLYTLHSYFLYSFRSRRVLSSNLITLSDLDGTKHIPSGVTPNLHLQEGVLVEEPARGAVPPLRPHRQVPGAAAYDFDFSTIVSHTLSIL